MGKLSRIIRGFLVIFSGLAYVMLSCTTDKKNDPEPQVDFGHITFRFEHYVDGQPMILDSMMYVNSAGNPYEINEVMYFISDVTLYKSDGSKKMISDWKDIHYVEDDIPETLTWNVFDDIETGEYDSITFIFGIPEEKNESFMFVNPPEDKMMWPDIMGGGYHYLMINGRWLNEENEERFYNFHLGIGQLYHGDTYDYDSIYAFVQNYFTVRLPDSSFTLNAGETKEIQIIMNIESWYETPHDFDFNYWGGAIMEIQPAMKMGCENGYDVFTVGYIK